MGPCCIISSRHEAMNRFETRISALINEKSSSVHEGNEQDEILKRKEDVNIKRTSETNGIESDVRDDKRGR